MGRVSAARAASSRGPPARTRSPCLECRTILAFPGPPRCCRSLRRSSSVSAGSTRARGAGRSAHATAGAPESAAAGSDGWTLAWADEFDGPAGTPADPARWVADTGGQGWGNRERQFYTVGPANAAHDGRGHLVITARAEPPGSEPPGSVPPGTARRCWYGPCRYTSARLTTKGRFTTTYGRIEARLRLPRGQGIWPAFWMLGADIDRVGWPRSGEIDVMEHIGREPRVVYGTLHGPGYSGAAGIGGPDTVAGGGPHGTYADAFHLFAVEWAPGEIRWLVDGRVYRRTTPADLPAGAPWVYDHPFFLLLNLAVGGNWPGDPDASTTFPQQLHVDYVRVYRQAAAGAAPGAAPGAAHSPESPPRYSDGRSGRAPRRGMGGQDR